MIFLFDSMSLVMPEIGYFFWTALAFIIFWILIGKYAVRPIQNSIEARNKSIEDSLAQAEIARKEIASMQAKNEDLLKEAREERTKIMNEAKAFSEKFRAEQKYLREQFKKYEGLKVDIKGFSVDLTAIDKESLKVDTIKLNKEIKWTKNIQKDNYIFEASNIVNDMK